jgi:hypothetical protein
MGKIATNEKFKLEAAFFNNLGVGAYIAGAVAPAVPFYQNFPFLDILLREGRLPPLPANLFTAIFLSLWCIGIAVLFRHFAHKMIDMIDG